MLINQHVIEITRNIGQALETRKQMGLEIRPVKLVAVTKNHGIEVIREAIDSGIMAIGENRVQEALSKQVLLERKTQWHLIGHLQTNKARQAVPAFDVIHSVDSEKLALEIDRVAAKHGKKQDVLLQVNIGGEDTKFGIASAQFRSFAAFLSNLEHVRLGGLMAIAPYYENAELARPLFRELYQMFSELQQSGLPNTNIEWLSMGMTHDYRVAIEEGSNLVRIGTGIFGLRK